MWHLSDGTLRRAVDEPLAVGPAGRRHLRTCPRCQRRLQEISALADRIAALLGPREGPLDLEQARSRLRAAAAWSGVAPGAPVFEELGFRASAALLAWPAGLVAVAALVLAASVTSVHA